MGAGPQAPAATTWPRETVLRKLPRKGFGGFPLKSHSHPPAAPGLASSRGHFPGAWSSERRQPALYLLRELVREGSWAQSVEAG